MTPLPRLPFERYRNALALMTIPPSVVITSMLGMSLVTGMPRGAVFGHEWGTAALSIPLRLPLNRPVYLGRNERVYFHYTATIRSGRLVVQAFHANDPLSLFLMGAQRQAFSVDASGSGVASFVAGTSGFYRFGVLPELPIDTMAPCQGWLREFWNATFGLQTSCPNFNMSYRLTIF